jgi:hypothetical protein
MTCRFTYDELTIELSAGYPPPCKPEEKDVSFHESLVGSGKTPRNLRPRDLNSWVVARLAALTFGGIQMEEDGSFANDGGEFAYRFKVTRRNGALVGKCGIILYPDKIEFAGFATGDENIRELFLSMLTAAPNEIDKCEIRVFDPDSGARRIYGWNGHAFLA